MAAVVVTEVEAVMAAVVTLVAVAILVGAAALEVAVISVDWDAEEVAGVVVEGEGGAIEAVGVEDADDIPGGAAEAGGARADIRGHSGKQIILTGTIGSSNPAQQR